MATQKSWYIFSKVGFGKLTTIVFGVIVLVIGLRSHFESAWVKYDFHKICNVEHNVWQAPCPDIAMERFYVAIVIICLILSSVGLILCTLVFDPYNLVFWMFDVCYHGMSAVLLFVAAILHVVSAIKISQHPVIIGDDFSSLPPQVVKIRDTELFLSTQKIIAGVLTMIDSFIYIATMWSIKRARANARALMLQSEDF